MVWFYLIRRAVERASAAAFNPTMVWFYQKSVPLFRVRTYSFQSHYGLILSNYNFRNIYQVINSFNPTMVWFYQTCFRDDKYSISELSIPLWSDFILPIEPGFATAAAPFQSHYGLILSPYNNQETPIIPYSFNPTMVWFYLWKESVIRDSNKNFQSHYGLILSPCTCRGETAWSGLSIPLWSNFIWRRWVRRL